MTMRSAVVLPDIARFYSKVLMNLLLDDKIAEVVPSETMKQFAELEKLGVLVCEPSRGEYEFACRFVKAIIWQTLFRATDHIASSFTTVDDFVVQLLGFRDDLFLENGIMRHEDSINRRLAVYQQHLLPCSAVYDGPVMLARGKGLEGQCDHVIYNLGENHETWLIEVLKEDLNKHSKRFATGGAYLDYNFHKGIILELRASNGTPRPEQTTTWVLDKSTVYVYVVYATAENLQVCIPVDRDKSASGMTLLRSLPYCRQMLNPLDATTPSKVATPFK